MTLRFFLLLLSLHCVPAWAVNKCVGPDGRVSYQEAPCDDAAKAQAVPRLQPPRAAGEGWQFLRQRDEMTGDETCFAVSPTEAVLVGPGYRTRAVLSVQLAVPVGGGRMALSARGTQGGARFHPRFEGGGIKPSDGEFTPFFQAAGAHGLMIANEALPPLLGALTRSRDLRMRVRVWPYDELLDTRPISMAGFDAATRRAMECAAE